MISCKHECMGGVATIIERNFFRGYIGFEDCNVDSLSEFKLSTLFCYCLLYIFFWSLLLFNP